MSSYMIKFKFVYNIKAFKEEGLGCNVYWASCEIKFRKIHKNVNENFYQVKKVAHDPLVILNIESEGEKNKENRSKHIQYSHTAECHC